MSDLVDLSSLTDDQLECMGTREAFQEIRRRKEHLEARLASVQVRWVQQAVAGAVAEADAYRRSVLTGRCAP